MNKRIKIDLLYFGDEELLFEEIGDHVDFNDFMVLHARNLDELLFLCQNYDFRIILLDLNLENYKSRFSFARNARKIMENYKITGKLYALSTIPFTPEIMQKHDFDEIVSVNEFSYFLHDPEHFLHVQSNVKVFSQGF